MVCGGCLLLWVVVRQELFESVLVHCWVSGALVSCVACMVCACLVVGCVRVVWGVV